MLRRNSFSFVAATPGFVYNVFWDQTGDVELGILQLVTNKHRDNISNMFETKNETSRPILNFKNHQKKQLVKVKSNLTRQI